MPKKSIEAVQSAAAGGSEFSSKQMEQVHLLLALLRQEGGLIPAAEKDGRYGGKSGSGGGGRAAKDPRSEDKSGHGQFLSVSADVQAAFNAAEQQAQTMKDEYVSVEHLSLTSGNCPGRREGAVQDPSDYKGAPEAFAGSPGQSASPPTTRGNLRRAGKSKYGTDLVKRAREQKMDPVIGRDEEIRNVIRSCPGRRSNNPVLHRRTRRGQTAIAEGLAQRIVKKDASPKQLRDKTIFSLIWARDRGRQVPGRV